MGQIRFEGEVCRTPNFSYHAAFASVFFLLALVCLIQLVMCIAAEFQKMKTPSLWRACRVTTQKLLYLLVFLATTIRGAYFTSPVVCLKTSYLTVHLTHSLLFCRATATGAGRAPS